MSIREHVIPPPVLATKQRNQAGEVEYPESDGEPMAENTIQFRWIVLLKENLESLFQERADVFVAGDLFWYPVEGEPGIRRAPDVLVVVGRPKGDRGSYQQWKEGDIAPQVVFEVQSPGNTQQELADKFEFYDLHGVEEYYLYNPEMNELVGWQRQADRLRLIEADDLHGWVSPRLGIRFEQAEPEWQLFYPDGEPFSTLHTERAARQLAEQQRQAEQQARQLAEQQRQQAEQQRQAEQQARQLAEQQRQAEQQARQQAEQQRQAEQQARQQAEAQNARLLARLRDLGIDPEQM